MSNYGDTWNTFLNAALFAYRTVQNHTTKYTPFKLLYGREAVLPMDLQGTNQEINKSTEESLQQHIKYITEDLQNIRINAKENIGKAQQNQRKYHDQKVKPIKFNI